MEKRPQWGGGAVSSTGLFEGLHGVVPAADGESYAEGALPYDPSAVSEVVDYYLGEGEGRLCAFYYAPWRHYYTSGGIIDGWAMKEMVDCRERYDVAMRGLEAMIVKAQGEGFDHNAFLDAALASMLSAADPAESAPEMLMDSLVQALYNTGRNGFTVNLMEAGRAEGKMPAQLGWGLEGSEERPLRVTYYGNAEILGAYARWCELDFHGSTTSAAYAAKDSVLRFHGQVEKIGGYAERCELWYAGSANSIIVLENGTEKNIFHIVSRGTTKLDLALAAASAFPQWILGLNTKGFLDQGNRLVIHAGKHSREVRW